MEQDFPKILPRITKNANVSFKHHRFWQSLFGPGWCQLAWPTQVSKLAKSTPEAMQKDEKVIQIGPNGFKLGPEGYYMVS